MAKPWSGLINLDTDDVSYGVYYDRDMVEEFHRMVEEDDNFDEAVAIERATMKRMSVAYNYLEDLIDTVMRLNNLINDGEAERLLDRIHLLLWED